MNAEREMYWADTEEGFQAFYACLLAMAKAEYQRRFPHGETQNSTDRKAAEETKGKGKKND